MTFSRPLLLGLCLSVALVGSQAARAESIGPWSLDDLRPAPQFEWVAETGPVRSLLYRGLPYRSAPTQVFAYYANPATLAGEEAQPGQFPGIVLIHGGGGTAFKTWVELWAKRGYAAIAMDLAGSRPDDADPKQRTRLEQGGPDQDNDAKFESIRTEDTSDDWPLHAVSNSVLAHSLLRAFREVDAERTAVTGISWGGYTCCLVASIDERFKAAVPVYGCGFLHENSSWLPQFAKLGPDLTKKWVELYDPSTYLPKCRVPLFFVNGTSDQSYPLDSYHKTLRAAGPAMKNVRIEVEMPHSHEAGWAPAEIGLFVDSQLGVEGSKPLASCGVASDDAGRVTAYYDGEAPLASAELHFAVSGLPITERSWQSRPATIKGRRISAEWLPPEADLFFLTLKDERGAMVSSKVTMRDAITVFEAPAIQETQNRVMLQFAQLAEGNNYAAAVQFLQEAVHERRLNNAVNRYNLACSLALLGRTDEALDNLSAAIDRGWGDVEHTEDDADFKSLRDLPRYKELIKQMQERPPPTVQNNLKPGAVENGVALVTETNTAWAPQILQFLNFQTFPAAAPETPIVKGTGGVADLLWQWQQEGTAAGLHGFLYDNHDRDHSNLAYGDFPQLARVEFSDAARQRNVDYGPQFFMLFNAPTLGNSSTANTGGPFWSSQTRMALRNLRTATALALQYTNNHIYFYPEHQDHDADNHGDVFHANSPYVITSQGSSGSDRPFMHAVASTLAAFTPETQRKLIEFKLLAPTVQMLLRSSLKRVQNPDDYLTGRAHPSVFDSADLDVERMVRAAHDMKADEVPPLIKFRVVEEDEAQVGVDYFEAAPGEKVFDSVCAISRVFRSSAWERRIIVSVEETQDPHVRPLTFHWKLLRGDPDRVTINPLNEQGTRAEIRVAWHERRPVEPESELLTSRVDIGVFAHNGVHYSAPAFVSYYCPASEERVYDGEHRIVSIEHFSPQKKERYADPALITPADWKDEFRHDSQGRLLGWTRTRGGMTEEFTRHGTLVAKKDDRGRPTTSRPVRYLRHQASQQAWPELRMEAGQPTVEHKYSSPDDLLGEPMPMERVSR